MIHDIYTTLALSRQRKYQLRHRDKGLCIKCNDKAITGGCCLKHAVQNRELIRERNGHVKRIAGKTYALEAHASKVRLARLRRKQKQSVAKFEA